jgi:hypothetical protein
VIRPIVEPAGGDQSPLPRAQPAQAIRPARRGRSFANGDWRVVDDLPTPVPIAKRELDVIERWLVAAGESEFGGSSAESSRTAPNQIGAGENLETLTSRKGVSL